MIPAPAPGLHVGVPADDYHAWDATNASLLVKLRDEPPQQVQHDLLHPKDPTRDMELGTLLHAALLEPDAFDNLYAIAPDVPKRGPANLALWAEFEAAHAGKIRVKQDDLDTVYAWRDGVFRNRAVREMLEGPGINEGSVVWIDPVTESPCKLRFDRLIQRGDTALVLDVKTAKNASREAFRRTIWNLGYHMSAAWYLRGLSEIAPAQRQFNWIVVDKREPHLVALRTPDPEDLAFGERECLRLAMLWKYCKLGNYYPGYNLHPGHADVCPLPGWVRKAAEDWDDDAGGDDNPDDQEIRF